MEDIHEVVDWDGDVPSSSRLTNLSTVHYSVVSSVLASPQHRSKNKQTKGKNADAYSSPDINKEIVYEYRKPSYHLFQKSAYRTQNNERKYSR